MSVKIFIPLFLFSVLETFGKVDTQTFPCVDVFVASMFCLSVVSLPTLVSFGSGVNHVDISGHVCRQGLYLIFFMLFNRWHQMEMAITLIGSLLTGGRELQLQGV